MHNNNQLKRSHSIDSNQSFPTKRAKISHEIGFIQKNQLNYTLPQYNDAHQENCINHGGINHFKDKSQNEFGLLQKQENIKKEAQVINKQQKIVINDGKQKGMNNHRLKKNKKNIKISQQKSLQKIKQKMEDQPPCNHARNVIVTRDVDFVPVDMYFSKRQAAKVLQVQKSFYSITMSQSNLAKDDNKFYILQIIVINNHQGEEYYLFSRWGRVGVIGQTSQNGPLQKQEAIRQYNSKSQGKMKIGGYKVIEMNYEQDKQKDMEMNIDQFFTKDNSLLAYQVQELVKLIFDIKMMKSHMMQIGYDQKRSPLGLIGKSSIDKGYISLDKIMKVLKGQTTVSGQSQRRKLLNSYSSQFYSAIPHDFGYMNMQAFVLNTQQKVKQKLQMLSSLNQIQIYSNLMNLQVYDEELSDIDIKYKKLNCLISPLRSNQPMFNTIKKYINNTHAKTHDKYKIQLIAIFHLRREQEQKRYKKEFKNKMLLWHGSRLTNYVGILSEGLKIAPYEAPSTGYMFGKGIYFADVVSKSANYCLPKNNTNGLMLLCEVALGETCEKYSADYNAHNLPIGKNSTKGVGRFAPGIGQYVQDVLIPNGQILCTEAQQSSLLYNEYIIYNRDQLICRYIVSVKFHLQK